MSKDEYVDLHSCLITNAQYKVIGLNFDKLLSIYLKYFPTVFQEDNNSYFLFSTLIAWAFGIKAVF